MIRSRYTVLDLAYETGRFHAIVQRVSEVWEDMAGPGARGVGEEGEQS